MSTAQPTSSTKTSTSTSNKGGGYSSGQAALRAHNYRAAEAAFRKSIGSGHNVTASYVGLATAAIALQDFPGAYKAYKQAYQRNPRNPQVAYGTAYAALYARDSHAAQKYASNYIALRPKDPAGYHLRFLAEGNLLLHKQQVVDGRAIVRLRPTGQAWNDLGIAYANDRQLAKSIAAFNQAIRLQPDVPSYYSNRAIVEDLMKHPQLALADLQRARARAKDPTTRRVIDQQIAAMKKRLHH